MAASERIRYIEGWLSFIANLKAIESTAIARAQHLIDELNASGDPQAVAESIIDTIGRENWVKSSPKSDHKHWVFLQSGEKRKGILIAVSKIPPRSDINPEPHEHPIDLLEIIIALTPGLVSIRTVDGKVTREPVEPLTVCPVPIGTKHSDCNEANEEVTYFIVRTFIETPLDSDFLKIAPR